MNLQPCFKFFDANKDVEFSSTRTIASEDMEEVCKIIDSQGLRAKSEWAHD